MTSALHSSPVRAAGFTADTMVFTASGRVEIVQLAAGEEVLARNEMTGDELVRPVVKSHRTPRVPTFDLSYVDEDGYSPDAVSASASQAFWVLEKGWTPLAELAAGDRILAAGSKTVTVSDVSPDVNSPAAVYNIEVADSHTHFVGIDGLWVRAPAEKAGTD